MEFSARQARADLRWLMDCPPLIASSLSWSGARIAELPESFSFEAVKRFHETGAAHRVGHYAEALFQAWLESLPDLSGVRHGIQIRREKETLGELDFLFEEGGRLHHLEVALKYYFYLPEGAANGSQFVGPNATDSFERKRDRLLQKQLPFGREFFPEIAVSHHAVKGMIFYHPGASVPDRYPRDLNPDHWRGIWIRHRELGEFLENQPSHRRGALLRKPFWLAAPDDPAASISLEEVAEAAEVHFSKWPGPVFLALLEDGAEVGRVFVAPDHWPAKAAGS